MFYGVVDVHPPLEDFATKTHTVRALLFRCIAIERSFHTHTATCILVFVFILTSTVLF